jgi:Transposase DDE domain
VLQRLSVLPLQSLAKTSGFVLRRPRKLSLEAFLQSILLSLCHPAYSFQSWAAQLSALQAGLFSKQALHRRCNRRLLAFLQLSLASLLGNFMRPSCPSQLFEHFGRVLLQDSTALALHPRLARCFPACGNQHKAKLASLKIQAIYELRSQSWLHFQLGALTDNDQKASGLILDHLKPGDLVIRDLGYAVLKVWRHIAQAGAFFLSRCRSDFAFFDPQTQQPLELLALLKDRHQLSIELLVGAQERLPVRLVALRLPPKLAAQRRRRARANAKRDRSLKLTKRYLKLLDWTTLLTNVPTQQLSAQQLSAQQLLEAYSTRWHIEVLFKSWKSYFQLAKLPTRNPLWVQIQLLAKLLAIALLQTFFAPNPFVTQLQALSPLKIAAYLAPLLPLIAASPHRDWL